MRRLKEEICSYHKVQINENVNTEKDKIPLITSSKKINCNENKTIDWSELEVDNWLSAKNINKTISENVKPCNGKILFQLYEIMISAPEFFFTSITSQDSRISTREVASFT